MATIKEMLDRLNNMDFDSIATDCVIETEDQLLDVNKDQLLHGMDASGRDMPDYRNIDYGQLKERMNPNNLGKWDLRFSGRLFNNMSIIFSGRTFLIDTSVDYANKYIFGFGIYENQWLDFYRANYLYPLLSQRVKEVLNI